MTGPGWVLSTLLAASSNDNHNQAVITGLHRHAVKGLGADALESVHIPNAYDTFPDDRRYALLYEKNAEKYDEANPDWLHKENFLCAFTNPELMANYETSYQILQATDDITSAKRLLSLRDRSSQESVFGPQDLATAEGREALGEFFSNQSGQQVQCIMAEEKQSQQKHQFGNTSSGWKQRKDTRTVHLVNANTVQQVQDKCNLPCLNPTRFRPNIVVEGWEPWAEFEWIGKTLEIRSGSNRDTMKLSILAKTVRCDGVSVDPLDPDVVLDIPKLLVKEFPEHGPYLGVYAVIEDPGILSLGDTVQFLK